PSAERHRHRAHIRNLLRCKIVRRDRLEIELSIDALDVAADLGIARERIKRKRMRARNTEADIARNDRKFSEFTPGISDPPWETAELGRQDRTQRAAPDDEATPVLGRAESTGLHALVDAKRLPALRYRRIRRVHVDPRYVDLAAGLRLIQPH